MTAALPRGSVVSSGDNIPQQAPPCLLLLLLATKASPPTTPSVAAWRPDCVAVRLHDHHGRPLGYAGRRLDTRLAHRLGKWKLPPRLPRGRILYNLHRLRSVISRSGLVLVECPWAVMRLDQLRIPALALLGVHLTVQQARLLNSAHRLVLLLDGDLPGRLASRRICHQLAGKAHSLALPDGIDPDDLSDRELVALIRPAFPFFS